MRQETRTHMLRVETLTLSVVSAAGAYLFYYVFSTHGGLFAGIAASMIVMHLIVEWGQLFYKLGLKS